MLECSQCKGALDASYGAPDQRPCPICGSTRRTINVLLNCEVKVECFAKVRVRSGKRRKGKPVLETIVGDEFHHGRGRWHTIHREIDRTKHRYYEHIEDKATCELIRHCEEDLHDHRDRGSAKKDGDSRADVSLLIK
jgi:hypothetical protein